MKELKEKLTVQPISDQLVVARDDSDETSEGGIVLPETARETPRSGKVIAVGPGKQTDSGRLEMEVSEGDRVFFGKYAGTEIEIAGDTFVVMQQSDVLLVQR